MNIIRNYWRVSRSPFYSLLFALPLLIGYELAVFTLNRSDVLGIRNGADILFRHFFATFGIYGFYLVGFLVLAALFLSYYFHTRRAREETFHFRFFVLMLLESILYGLVMFVLIEKIGRYNLSAAPQLATKHMIVLALGAGVYEEFIFRVILVSGFAFFFKDILKLQGALALTIAIVGAAAIFALFHYLGVYGETFALKSFLIRFAAGVFLSVLYTIRGYGITAYTHTFYDLIVIIL